MLKVNDVDFKHLLIVAKGTRLLRDKAARVRPHRSVKRRGGSPDAPRKASACSGNQQSSLKQQRIYSFNGHHFSKKWNNYGK
jgi:hypothetical protein